MNVFMRGLEKIAPPQKPARIHSPDPFLRAGGKQKQPEAKRKNPFPQKNRFSALPKSELKPRHTARILGGQNPKRKMSFPFSEKIGRAQIRKARNIFLWCPPRLCEAVAGLIHSSCFRSKKVRAKCIITAQKSNYFVRSNSSIFCLFFSP